MSKIDQIIAIEQEADNILATSKKEAERIKAAGLVAAREVIQKACAQKTAQANVAKSTFQDKLVQEEQSLKIEFEQISKERNVTFEKNKADAVDWVISKIIG